MVQLYTCILVISTFLGPQSIAEIEASKNRCLGHGDITWSILQMSHLKLEPEHKQGEHTETV